LTFRQLPVTSSPGLLVRPLAEAQTQ
jgi:hypothetical protein